MIPVPPVHALSITCQLSQLCTAQGQGCHGRLPLHSRFAYALCCKLRRPKKQLALLCMAAQLWGEWHEDRAVGSRLHLCPAPPGISTGAHSHSALMQALPDRAVVSIAEQLHWQIWSMWLAWCGPDSTNYISTGAHTLAWPSHVQCQRHQAAQNTLGHVCVPGGAALRPASRTGHFVFTGKYQLRGQPQYTTRAGY